jgi:hypothetical protein
LHIPSTSVGIATRAECVIVDSWAPSPQVLQMGNASVLGLKTGYSALFQHINSPYYYYCYEYIQIQEKESPRREKLSSF